MKILIILEIALLTISACSNTLTGDVVDEPIRIGGAFALTGISAQWGEVERDGALLAIDEINARGGVRNKQLELIIEDTQGQAVPTVNAVRKLIDVTQVDYIIGPTWLETYAGAAPIIEDAQVLAISPSFAADSLEESYSYIFSTWYSTKTQYYHLMDEAKNQGVKSISLMYENEPYFNELAGHIKTRAKENGITVHEDMNFPAGTTDFRSHLVKANKDSPEVLFFGSFTDQSVASFLQQRAVLFPELTIYAGDVIQPFVEKEVFHSYIYDIWYPEPVYPRGDFSNSYIEKYGREPTMSAANAYDAMYLVADAIENTQSTTDAKEYLATGTFTTITFGQTTFDAKGGVVGGEFIVKNYGDPLS